MKRNIITIDKDKCNGCGLCINACHEGAIQLIDGKAELISDQYCDGLGNCLPACPTGAIEIIEREAVDFSEEAVEALKKSKQDNKVVEHKPLACGCPGTMAKKIEKAETPQVKEVNTSIELKSQLSQWPIQLMLINPRADYLNNANLLIAADCTAYAYANFHNEFIKNHITIIGCPKLDDNDFYKEKLVEILCGNNIKSITVVRMEVPCCGGIVASVRSAMLESGTIVPYREVTVGIDGSLIE